MAITLSAETQKLIESRMKDLGCENADDFIQVVVQTFSPDGTVDLENLDPEILASIEEGEREYQQGLARPWEEVREELRAKSVVP